MATPIRLNPEIEEKLTRLAARTGRTKDACLNEIVERGLAETEDYYAAFETLERVRGSREEVYTSQSVRTDLGLEN